MKDFILLMYNDATNAGIASDGNRWAEYLSRLRSSGHFEGGSSIGAGVQVRKDCADIAATSKLDGFIRVRALDVDAARHLLAGNPIYEGGGTVEIRELPVDS